jgi:hypothetical protein
MSTNNRIKDTDLMTGLRSIKVNKIVMNVIVNSHKLSGINTNCFNYRFYAGRLHYILKKCIKDTFPSSPSLYRWQCDVTDYHDLPPAHEAKVYQEVMAVFPQLYINLIYDQKFPSDTIHHGQYNTSNHGGACDWVIATTQMNKCIGSSVYNHQKRLYVFSFYSRYKYKQTGLYELMQKFTNNTGVCTENNFNDDDPNSTYTIEFIYLTNDTLPNYNEKEECLNDILTGQIDPDEFGGLIYFSYIHS